MMSYSSLFTFGLYRTYVRERATDILVLVRVLLGFCVSSVHISHVSRYLDSVTCTLCNSLFCILSWYLPTPVIGHLLLICSDCSFDSPTYPDPCAPRYLAYCSPPLPLMDTGLGGVDRVDLLRRRLLRFRVWCFRAYRSLVIVWLDRELKVANLH